MKEKRICEIRADNPKGSDALYIKGVPVVYDTPTVIDSPAGRYIEVIRRGALDSADLSDCRLLYNHDLNKVPLARTPKTMQLMKGAAGLEMAALLPDTEEGRGVHTAVLRGDLSGMSFSFKIPPSGDRWNGHTREILKVSKVYEISIVPFPAYPETSVEARTALQNMTKGSKKSMKFKTVQEAFNHYRKFSLANIEKRAAEIDMEIHTDPTGDIPALNIELEGLIQAKVNVEDKGPTEENGETEERSVIKKVQTALNQRAFNPVTGMSFGSSAQAVSGDVFSSREYRSAFFKTMLEQPLNPEESAAYKRARGIMATKKRAAFINQSEAAAVIPTQTLNEIFQKAVDMGAVLSLVRRFDMPANLAVPVATPEDAAEWHIEGAEVKPSNKKPTNVIFNAFELMKVFSMSAAARTMSIQAFESYLQSELVRTMITAMQMATISGTGSGQPKGLLNAGVITNTHSGAASYATLLATAAKLMRGYSSGAAWAMNNATLYNRIMAIVDGNGRPMLNEPKDGDANRILGHSIVVDDFIPDDTVIYGNFQYYGFNYPQDIMLEVSRDSSFRRGLIDYRALAVCDGKPILPEAFVNLTLTS
ncbi:MAG: phage major capsid protein [Clostridia bacterium]|nr:phage major capsid protein [Clostridia bacterium]